ncbi:hypothetical protein EY643_15830 [Halioglobus maricola]|uniref:Uncharacterized protein n=1 Tax=Halioglobus maricola TaxID=2601894 RepID=A0A5P9NMY9_9GAMM|nr:PilC/PilY family type IV pilus protein [Halioglobus maricola]QFU76999.1 hypothetical protein EY643_15830 [Halioglobus maricola]
MAAKLNRALAAVPLVAAMAAASLIGPAQADDTEIYKAVFSSDTGYKPQVIILFDDSGSMRNTQSTKPRYDGDTNYSDDGSIPANRIYWSTDGDVPEVGSSQWFTADANQCATSTDRLDDKGFFLASGALRWYDPEDDVDTCGPYYCADGSHTYYEFDPTGGTQNNACWTTSSITTPADVWVEDDNDTLVSSFFGPYCDDPDLGLFDDFFSGHSTVLEVDGTDGCYDLVESGASTSGYVARGDDDDGSCPSPEVYIDGGGTSGCFEYVTGEVGEETGTTYSYQTTAIQDCPSGVVTTGEWLGLSDEVNTPTHVECYDDVEDDNDSNPNHDTDGFPQDNVNDGSEYAATVDETVSWGNTSYYFYTSNYMRWQHDTTDSISNTDRSKLDIAQEVVEDIVYTTPSVDFGLLEFNHQQGGRLTQRVIANMDDTDITTDGVTRDARENLIYLVNELQQGGNTPMCESLYEAYLYLSRSTPEWYDNASSSDGHDPQPYDSAAIVGGVYAPPVTPCANTYLILMTDGKPNKDVGSNDAIKTVIAEDPDISPTGSNGNCTIYPDDDGNTNSSWSLTDADGNTSSGSNGGEYCMPELAEYMANNDLDDNESNGKQYAKTYTIGFATNQEILQHTAEKGDGAFYEANNAQALRDAFRDALISILADETTFTSPAVAVDTFTRTQSRNEIFYAMFEPGDTVDWAGNIKKLNLVINDDGAVLQGGDNQPALDENTGEFLSTAVTVWSTEADGGTVTKGGVGGLLAALPDLSVRNLYINTGTNGALEAFNTTNIDADAMGVGSDSALYQLFGTNSATAFAKQIAWGQGYDAYNEDGDADVTDNRPWIMGDILHSQPLVINYGALGSATIENPDLRIVAGTNAGWIHMFGNTDGHEDWAFFPKELASKMAARRADAESAQNVYGMDLTATLYTSDIGLDGTIDSSDGDKAFIFMGQRRGGKAYYALDVSNPDVPAFKWMIDNSTAGYDELGMTFSQPIVTFIPGYVDANGYSKPVLVFGAGYDTNKDSTAIGSVDNEGRGIFIVDADSGALVWSVTPGANSATNLNEPDLNHSVPAQVSVLDSNGDRLTDRIYFGDTGGFLWRVDLAGNSLPDSNQDTWLITKVGDFNDGSTLTDRRFFNAPDIVRIRVDGQAVDAVIIGTGDRTNPNGTDVDNTLYMIRDVATTPYSTAEPSVSDCATDGFVDFRCDLPLTEADLYDITDNAINDGSDTEMADAVDALQAAHGWKFDLVNLGEKSLAQTLSIDGKVYVPTFTPSNEVFDDGISCGPSPGTGIMYIIDLYDGERAVLDMGDIIPDTPSLHVAEDGKIRLLLPPGTPAANSDEPGEIDCEGGICDVNESLRPPYGNYWFQEDY